MLNKIIIVFMSVLLFLSASCQSNEDTLKQLTALSRNYINTLFNSRNIGSAAEFWDTNIYESLKVGYNNGNIQYKSNSELLKLFSEDLSFVFNDIDSHIEFIQDDSSIFFREYSSQKYFYVSFTIPENIKIDSMLRWVAIELYSADKGKTWKLNTDFWIGNFMYYLYRQGKSKRPYSRKINYP